MNDNHVRINHNHTDIVIQINSKSILILPSQINIEPIPILISDLGIKSIYILIIRNISMILRPIPSSYKSDTE